MTDLSEVPQDEAGEQAALLQRTIEHRERMVARKEKLREDLEEILRGRERIVWEVGCGHGHFLTGYAQAHPEALCIGVDIIEDRIFRGERKRNRAELANLHFLRAEANLFLEVFPKQVSIETVFVLFSDPWPKKRHHKNRIIQQAFLSELASHCAPGARLHFRTDFDPYYDWAVEHVQAHPAWQLRPDLPWPFELETVFQSRAASYQSLVAEHCPDAVG